MCVAIYKSPKGELTKEVLEKCFDQNPDGAGFVLAHNDKFHMQKGFFTFEKFWKAFKPYAGKGTQGLVHFRIASHGKVNEENSHPHKIDDDHYMIHNGVFSAFAPQATDAESDTRVFVRKVLTPMMKLDPNALYDQGLMNYTQDAISHNKVVILRRDGSYLIMNARFGDWIEENWFSNVYWRYRSTDKKKDEAWGSHRRHGNFLTEGDFSGYGEDTGETIAAPSIIAPKDTTPGELVKLAAIKTMEEVRRRVNARAPIPPSPTSITDAGAQLSSDWIYGNNDAVTRVPPAHDYWGRPEYTRGYLKVLGAAKGRDPGRFVEGVRLYTETRKDLEESVFKGLHDDQKAGWLWAQYFKWSEDNKEQRKLLPKELKG